MSDNDDITDSYVRQLYDNEYAGEDVWHTYADENTKAFLSRCVEEHRISTDLTFLSIGSGGIPLPLPLSNEIQSDLCATRLKGISRAIVADVRCLPFADASVDVACMMGEVIGYCDPHQALLEICRILRPGGYFFFDFSQSTSAEFAFKKGYGSPAIINEMMYCGMLNKIWTYSDAYLRSALRANSMVVHEIHQYHIISSAIMRFYKEEVVATRLARVTDPLMRKIPFFKRFAAQAIFFCQKVL